MKKKNNYIYISRSGNVSDSYLSEFILYLKKTYGFSERQITFHTTGTSYSPKPLLEAAMVFILVGSSKQLGRGTCSEIELCSEKSSALAYQRKCDNSFQFYNYDWVNTSYYNDWKRYGEIKFENNISRDIDEEIRDIFEISTINTELTAEEKELLLVW